MRVRGHGILLRSPNKVWLPIILLKRHHLSRRRPAKHGGRSGVRSLSIHPDLLMVGKRSAVIGIVETPAPGLPTSDRFEIVSLLHVVSLEPHVEPRPSGSGGETAS